MDQELTIGEVAARVGISAKTIRFYESEGVIKPLARQSNTYRHFSERDIERLLLIKRARNLGLPLAEIKNIVSECIDKGCAEARQYIAAKVPIYLAATEKRIAELEALKEQLLYLQRYYKKNGKEWQHRTDACCQIIPTKEERI
jgi:MerR family copper efflux transcriptional regulator